jgi:uncharacterized phage protein (TIGR01671 family)
MTRKFKFRYCGEIKFRDYDPETKEIRYFGLDQYDREVHDSYGNITQFTGLLDKNGKEIYEGDIIDYAGWAWYRSKLLIVVEWSSTLSGFEPFVDYNKDLGIDHPSSECLVIGNIYENPELLTE